MVEPVTYAMINSLTEYVEGVVTIDYEHVQQDDWVIIPTEDQSLIGKWYNSADGQFYDKPNGYLIRLKTVDGANSGLDADMLDGKHASDFLETTGGTVNGNLNVNGVVRVNGNQAIYDTDDYMIFGTNNKPTLIACKSDQPITFNGLKLMVPAIVPRNTNTHGLGQSGQRFKDCYLVNTPNVSSDRRLKQDIVSVDADDMLEFVEKLDVVNYAFKDDPETERIGLIAQDVETAGGNKFVEVGDDGMYGLKTADLVYPLIGCIQALSKQNAELMERVSKLEKTA